MRIVTLKQCHGPGCTSRSRDKSNYCSDRCGIELAKLRLHTAFDNNQHLFSRTYSAEQTDLSQIAQIKQEISQTQSKLADADRRRSQLLDLIQRAKQTPPWSSQIPQDESHRLTMLCFVCGAEVSNNAYSKHVDKCFRRCESQTSFTSPFRSRNETESLFCEAHKGDSYCKRIRLVCPQHSKPFTRLTGEVCGFPDEGAVASGDYLEATEFCGLLVNRCPYHSEWDRVALGRIDLEKVRLMGKQDELFERERVGRMALASRGSIMSLMLED